MNKPFPAYRGDDPYVFVSYAHPDGSIVYPELTRLDELGYNILYDEGISPGSSWRNEIAESIDQCSLFVIFITPQSAGSETCVREVRFALEHGRPVLAIHLVETDLPMELGLSLADPQAVLKHELTESEYNDRLSRGMATLFEGGRPDTTATPRSVHAAGIPATNPAPTSSRHIGIGIIVLIVAIGIGFFIVFDRPTTESDQPQTAVTEAVDPPT